MIAVAAGDGEYCVALMFVRGGRSLGSTTFFPKAPLAELPEVLSAFVAQYYLERESPAEIIVEREFDEMPHARGDAGAARRPQGAHHRLGPRHPRTLARDDARQRRAGAQDALRSRAAASSRVSRICAKPSTSRRRRAGSSASTSATRAARTPWPPAWCSASRGRSRASTAASTSPASSPATTMPPCIRR